jgi:glycosyltransferase involved in cell wall biosynthesis
LRIIHVITTIERGGAEKQLLTLAKRQVETGKNISILYLKGTPELAEEFTTIGSSVIGEFANKNPLIQFLRLRRFLHRNEDIWVHAHLPRAEMMVGFSSRKKKFIFSRHNAEPFFPGSPGKISSFLSRSVSRRAFSGIMISQDVLKFCQDHNEIAKGCRIEVVYYGVTDNLEIVRKPREISESQPVHFGTVSRLVPQKDIPTLLAAFSLHLREFPKDTLRIVGSGPLSKSLVDFCKSKGISDQVFWLGRTDNVSEFYSTLDVFVLSSKYEGFGLVLLEAMQMGLPIISSNISAIPEVVGEGNGLFFEVGNPQELSTRMCEMRGTEMRTYYSDLSRMRSKVFSATKMETKIEEVISKMQAQL